MAGEKVYHSDRFQEWSIPGLPRTSLQARGSAAALRKEYQKVGHDIAASATAAGAVDAAVQADISRERSVVDTDFTAMCAW